ncbi:N-carbamoyl-L-amino acid amidohydrolase [Pseudomonas sp. MTM4]|uniref:hypothetical protein n=1 Tax=unclassified Pseudomonas TaxID=196821 RepID=UPI0018D22B45|nr:MULTISPECIES: hypothetical protein [unclassified Pseudomonas]MBC8651064.1 N-carbamoyl-L-amino acid amidohydrolase [Pseudomonas sp. MT4]QXY93285.1 N-carbamoyl-L-amino acid amidohydrolase [Pseudomonas sp. MTM4]
MTEKSKSPYLNSDNRLEDVIAAIQVMEKYGYYKLDFGGWSIRISGNNIRALHWKNVFLEHPEFFRFDSNGEKVSLAWRRNCRRRYSVDHQRELSFNEYKKLPQVELDRISRVPLTGGEISILINTAINLHTRAIDQNKENRWLSSPLFSLLGVALGAFLVWIGQQ